MMKINLKKLQNELLAPARELLPILNLTEAPDGLVVSALLCENGKLSVGVDLEKNTAFIEYSEPAHFFRGLGILFDLAQNGGGSVTENPSHRCLGPMLDCSRNAVLTVDAVKKTVRHIALMGCNTLMLYTEDTYTLDGEPYFGYMRGRYSHSEIEEVDNYCRRFGIELIPCMQTLAHLGEVLKWNEYQSIRDVGDILLAGEPKTYEFIEKMIKTCSENFVSKRILIGMDEAWMLGQGQYLDRNGLVPKDRIMREHLKKVCEICDKYGFAPMIWSDMLFNRDADGNPRDRYDFTTSLPEDIHSVPPRNVTLIYWDYYNGKKSTYDGVIEMHQTFDNPIAFAGGAWKWVGFAPLNHYSFSRSLPAIKSCFEHNVTDIIVTAWGDNGCECPLFAILPVFQLYAEGCFSGDISYERAARRFKTCVGGNMDDFMMLDMPQLPEGNFNAPTDDNPAKYLVYADPLLGLADKHVGDGYSEAYAEYASHLSDAARRNPNWSYLFKCSAALCRFLSEKVDLSIKLKAAYDSGNKDELLCIKNGKLKRAITELDAFQDAYRKQWFTDNKPFGFEVIDLRLGGLKNRLISTDKRLGEYLGGEINEIPELAADRLRYDCRSDCDKRATHVNNWAFSASTNIV